MKRLLGAVLVSMVVIALITSCSRGDKEEKEEKKLRCQPTIIINIIVTEKKVSGGEVASEDSAQKIMSKKAESKKTVPKEIDSKKATSKGIVSGKKALGETKPVPMTKEKVDSEKVMPREIAPGKKEVSADKGYFRAEARVYNGSFMVEAEAIGSSKAEARVSTLGGQRRLSISTRNVPDYYGHGYPGGYYGRYSYSGRYYGYGDNYHYNPYPSPGGKYYAPRRCY